MTFTNADLKRLKEDGAKYGYQLCKQDGTILDLWALLARLEVGERCAQLLADYVDHDHVYWSSPKELTRCTGVNSIDECDFTMNLRRQYKKAVEAWRKACGE